MRILILAPQVFYSTRGTPLSVYHRAKILTGLGHDVEILTYPAGNQPPDLDVKIHRARGLYFIRNIEAGPSCRKIWFDCWFFMNFFFRLLRGRYDIVFGHEEGGFMASLASHLFRVPVVYEMHSSLPLQINEWNFSKNRLVIGFFRWVERVAIRNCMATVAISPGVAQAARAAVPEANVVMVPNLFPVSADRHTDSHTDVHTRDSRQLRQELGLSHQHKVVLYTGSFVPLQALDLLITSIPGVVRRLPMARFVLVGGRRHEIESLQNLAATLEIASHVQLLPARPLSDMPIFEAASDVLVSPRITGINPPGKLYSYLQSRRPVVATNCLVHTQFLDDSVAILTPPDPEGLANGIIAALEEKERTRRLTAAALELVRVRFCPEQARRIYKELLDSAPQRRAR